MVFDTEELREKIEDKKKTLEDRYAVCLVAARATVKKYEELLLAEENREIKNGSREKARFEIVQNDLKAATEDFYYFTWLYDVVVDELLSLYAELVSASCAKVARKVGTEAEKLEEYERYRKNKLFDLVLDIDGIKENYLEYTSGKSKKNNIDESHKEDAPKTEESDGEAKDGTSFENYNGGYNESAIAFDTQRLTEPKESVPVAPASIDISHIVEEAVSLAINKFNSVLESRLDSLNDSGASSLQEFLRVHNELVGFELEAVTKLSDLSQKLKKVSDDMISIGAAYMQLANMQSDVADNQKRVNDIQRVLVRDMQGIQANQKVILKEQSEVMADQAAIIERQKTNAENQAMLNEKQAETAELHKSISEAQSAVVEAGREALASQKNIISMQQSAMSAHLKTIGLQRELIQKQNEVTLLQKAVISEHKNMRRKIEKERLELKKS